ncbi:hypothetical protein LB58_18780 [Salmonella enterica]|nr:hypothetical protein [Salmonella enterica]
MLYLINNEITFRTDDGVLAGLSSPENSVVLSITANRVFSYLLEQRGNIVSREDILVNVWDKHGFQASNNSLSQYISLIRRGLHDLGCIQEVIQTIPRAGFLVPGDYISIIEHDSYSGVNSLNGKESVPVKKTPISAKICFFVMALLLSSLAIAFYPLQNGASDTISSVKTWKLGMIDQCPVFTFYKNSPEMMPVKLEEARLLTKSYLQCIKGATFYFQPDDLYTYGEKGRVFLSRCTWSNKEQTKFAGCKDIYIHEN